MTNNTTLAAARSAAPLALWLVPGRSRRLCDDDGHTPDHGACSCPRSTPPPVWALAASAWRLRLGSCGGA